MKSPKKVVLDVETNHSYGRGLTRGIVDYARLNGSWILVGQPPFYSPNTPSKMRLAQLRKINPDGIIIREPRNIKDYIRLKIPIIVSPNKIDARIPYIQTDADQIGSMAAEHFLERGFTNFAYCGFKNMPWSIDRFHAFNNRVIKAGFTVGLYLSRISQISSLTEHLATKLPKWLHSLRFPTGVMCCNDDMSRILLGVCKSAQINVPEQIAVVGVDNDDLVCELTDPPLSSVSLNSRSVGFEAAALLDSLMEGTKKMAGQVIMHHPSFVVTRQSSDVYAIKDKDVAGALSFIRAHSRKPILVSDVARHVSLSERQLFAKFQSTLCRSVHDEIKRIRIEQISKLLIETDLSITEIAYSMGFTGTEHISRYFKQIKGVSLKTYRMNMGRESISSVRKNAF